ncbi:hypothetical protein A2961_03915 [Candidatus Woesebacteria bacterium RIFCSPLOWO2_01_FULL_39_21]|uniref:DNA-directed DNA polymerase X domain-containing protein n=1 Tax=Candidatus Woesebacteria bacterium RIFCSPLOWO2_01_FULL_39_21 TaxID=1802519 RepID=A0A1F8BC14_9BACT|nr:MAG: hypothetical protein A2691_04045 [Candidatus Woesebacteria bacterium RIFCSPHIGHO2_01_FULL_39_23]OGM61582.1 MAG: hypothetical protein A2961_03915 [Candidatus Woesebacteria bacterium RIFCSPLOWO2_01_FULL_39_21]
MITNTELAELLRDIAAAYKIKGEKKNRFRIIAYERAADAVEHLSSEAKDLWDEGKLMDVSGIGPSITAHLDELFKTGKSKHFDEVLKGLPPAMFELMKVPGIGAKTAYKLSKELGIAKAKNALRELKKSLRSGRVARIEGFGEISEQRLEKSIGEVKKGEKRLLLPYATLVADEVMKWLKKLNTGLEVHPLGSLRRKASTVGDVDLAISTKKPVEVLHHFVDYPRKLRKIEEGPSSASIMLPGNVQVDAMVSPPRSYGALLQHFTGSKHHNIALREHALKMGFSLNEKGIKNLKTKKMKNFETEVEFYEALGMEWIPPEIREDTGEIQAALNNKLPDLVDIKDIKGDLQIHSSFDIETSHDLGQNSMDEIAKRADELGYEYIAFTEHNPSQSGHNERSMIELLKRKREAVDKLNYSLVKTMKSLKKIFNSLEIDIMPNGELPVPETGFDYLDFALCSIHSSFRQNKKDMTNRVLNAFKHPKTRIFAHPTTRILNKREGVEFDWGVLFDFFKKSKKIVEINADPIRLDLPDILVREAVKFGVKMSLGTDTHYVTSMGNMVFGVSVARRGWAKKRDIINTYSLEEIEKILIQ